MKLFARTLAFVTLGFSINCFGFYQVPVYDMKTHDLDDNLRFKLLNAFQACDNNGVIVDDCVINTLTQINEPRGLEIIQAFNKAMNDGSQDEEKCRTVEHKRANYVYAKCVLELHKKALESQSYNAASEHYVKCLQNGFLGLTYGNNMVALYRLRGLFTATNQTSIAHYWSAAFEDRKGEEAYELVKYCYRLKDDR